MDFKERYGNFAYLAKPTPFDKLFKDKNYEVVQLHDISDYTAEKGFEVIGFCGACKWQDNVLTSLDGDSYTETMEVWGYCEFDCDGNPGLDILVKEW